MIESICETSPDVFNSWKEISAYLGRGVRTAQRWERELGLPVRRPRGKSRSAVIAIRHELKTWLESAPRECHKRAEALSGAQQERDGVALLRESLAARHLLHQELRRRCDETRAAMTLLLSSLHTMEKHYARSNGNSASGVFTESAA